jgi:hypothetical protein
MGQGANDDAVPDLIAKLNIAKLNASAPKRSSPKCSGKS